MQFAGRGKLNMEQQHVHWNIEMFGGLRASRGGQETNGFQTRKTATLFAYLAFYSHKRHLREELADLLWPDAELESGRHRLAQALFALRSQFETEPDERGRVLQADRHTVRINPNEVTVDALRFSRAVAASGAITDPQKRIINLENAIACYTGEFLPGFYEDWVLAERQWLSEQFVGASRTVIKHFEATGMYDKAIRYARTALAVNPLAEDLSEDLIRLLASSGQTGAALSYYREFERLLLKEIGEPPSGPVRGLVDKIRESETTSTIQPRSNEAFESNLPVQLTRFFGRETEKAYIQSMIESGQARLITITGMGGSGKTRLSIESAWLIAAHFDNAVYFVPLADLQNADQIVGEIVAALQSASFAGTSLEQVIEFLRRRKTLLILDNLEHIQEAAVPLIHNLLKRLPKLSLMITSRNRLGMVGEREIPLPPLQTPTNLLGFGQGIDIEQLRLLDTVKLFVDRAQAVRPEFTITIQNALTVAKVCEKLEGLPLAIELCAAWAQILTPDQMLTQLDSRFVLLAGRSTDLQPRHRSLRTAMEYSKELLPESIQVLFAQLSVFRSGWTFDATAKICAGDDDLGTFDSNTALAELNNRSLIIIQQARTGNEMRYRMLDTVREFAAELLTGEQQLELRMRHALYYLALIESAEEPMKGVEQLDWIKRLDDEHDNLRAAITWIFEFGGVELSLRMASAMTTYWDMRGYLSEGNYWLEKAISLPLENDHEAALRPLLAKTLTSYAYLVRVQGNSAKVSAAAREGLRLYRELKDDQGLAFALQVLAVLTFTGEDCDEARIYLEEGLELARRLNDRSLLALSLANLGNIALEQSNFDEADQLYTESVKLYLEDTNRHQASRILNNLGVVSTFRGDYAKARQYLNESLTISKDLSNYGGIALGMHNLGDVERKQGNYEADVKIQFEAARIAYEIGERRLLAFGARDLGHVYCQMGKYDQGVRLMAIAEVLRQSLRLSFKPADPKERKETLKAARKAIGDRADQIWTDGLKTTDSEANEEALEALGLAPPKQQPAAA
jgi:predicted ATPase/DNA-binding SARP family transcriptional activator